MIYKEEDYTETCWIPVKNTHPIIYSIEHWLSRLKITRKKDLSEVWSATVRALRAMSFDSFLLLGPITRGRISLKLLRRFLNAQMPFFAAQILINWSLNTRGGFFVGNPNPTKKSQFRGFKIPWVFYQKVWYPKPEKSQKWKKKCPKMKNL